MTRSLLSRASELQQRGLALERKSREHTNFCEYVVALLENAVNAIRDEKRVTRWR